MVRIVENRIGSLICKKCNGKMFFDLKVIEMVANILKPQKDMKVCLHCTQCGETTSLFFEVKLENIKSAKLVLSKIDEREIINEDQLEFSEDLKPVED